jgi:hypothetical protein
MRFLLNTGRCCQKQAWARWRHRGTAEAVTGLSGQPRGKTRREYQENTKTTPKHLPSNWLAPRLHHAFSTPFPPKCQSEPSGIPGRIPCARARTQPFHPPTSSRYRPWLRRSRAVSVKRVRYTSAKRGRCPACHDGLSPLNSPPRARRPVRQARRLPYYLVSAAVAAGQTKRACPLEGKGQTGAGSILAAFPVRSAREREISPACLVHGARGQSTCFVAT